MAPDPRGCCFQRCGKLRKMVPRRRLAGATGGCADPAQQRNAADPSPRKYGSAAMHGDGPWRSEEHTSELQSLMRISYAVFCLKKKKTKNHEDHDYKTSPLSRAS